MNYQDLQTVINGGDIAKTIEFLTSQADQPEIKKLQSQWLVSGHGIMDRCKRRDREVLYEEVDEDNITTTVNGHIEQIADMPAVFAKYGSTNSEPTIVSPRFCRQCGTARQISPRLESEEIPRLHGYAACNQLADTKPR